MTNFHIPRESDLPPDRSTCANSLEHSFCVDEIAVTVKDSKGDPARHAHLLERAIQVNKALFDVAPASLLVIVVNNLTEWKAAAGPYGHLEFAWGVTLDDGTVVVKAPEYSGIEPSRFEKVVTHETNHSFWVSNFGRLGAGWSPNWVVEGFANLAAPARDLISPAEVATIAARRGLDAGCLEYTYRDLTGPEELIFLYSLWRAVTADLSAGGSVTPLMECIRTFAQQPSEERFNQTFVTYFGMSLADYFSNFLRRIAT